MEALGFSHRTVLPPVTYIDLKNVNMLILGGAKEKSEIKNTDTGMQWNDRTNSAGYYDTSWYKFCSPSKMEGYYELWVGGDLVAGQSLTADDFVLL